MRVKATLTCDLISNIEDLNNQPETTTSSGMKTMWYNINELKEAPTNTNQQTNPRDPALDKVGRHVTMKDMREKSPHLLATLLLSGDNRIKLTFYEQLIFH